MKNRPVNLLLILSSKQLPEPEFEVLQLSELAKHQDLILFATTRSVNSLTQDKSKVVLYGDEDLDHKLLAEGVFQEYIPLNSTEGESIANSDTLYEKEYPLTLRGFLKLSSFELIGGNKTVDDLSAVLEDGELLTSDLPIFNEEENPFGRRKNSIYYIESSKRARELSFPEQRQLLLCKYHELEDKSNQLARFWQESEKRRSALISDSEKVVFEAAKEIDRLKNQQTQRTTTGLLSKLLTKHILFSYSKIEFMADSIDKLINRYHVPENVIRLLSDLNHDFHKAKKNWKATKWQGTNNWWEYRAKKDCRIYFRSNYRNELYSPMVLISDKPSQNKDSALLKKHDK